MSRWHVVVIEDDPASSRLVAEILRPFDMEVECAGDGVAGLQLVRDSNPDLVILDIALPRIDGWSVLATIRSGHRTPDVPVVVTTAHGQGLSAERAFELGAQHFFEKPFIPSELAAVVQSLLAGADASDRTSA